MSENTQSLPLAERRAAKEKKRQHEEITRMFIVFSIGVAAIYGLITSGYIDNPLTELHQDTSITVEDTSANK
ncbi:MAG TPA: hypothetical protein PLJ04_00675 [Candidatus Saccharibacteria bacterium]|nr:hypothetical protein [Candidatus Saccharibacteria bacterium]MCB9816919.1 hypothetical protein [Candidatus Nomurabacteria bacterium]HPD98666.1 hypothetical protein [Candidatus Saccharibacteria bacterium]HPR10073.1 hypothetical protein [Candidatus Saccharibacteria bacterium]